MKTNEINKLHDIMQSITKDIFKQMSPVKSDVESSDFTLSNNANLYIFKYNKS